MDYQRNDRYCPTCRAARGQRYAHSAPHEGCGDQHENRREPINVVENPTMIAMVYAPKQAFRELYEPMKALSRGTLFAELDKPFNPSCHARKE